MAQPLYSVGERVLVCTDSGQKPDIVVAVEYLHLGEVKETPTTRHKVLVEGYFYRVCHCENNGIRLFHERRLRKLPDASDWSFDRLMDELNTPKGNPQREPGVGDLTDKEDIK